MHLTKKNLLYELKWEIVEVTTIVSVIYGMYIFSHVYMVCVGVWCVPTTMSVLYELSYDVWGWMLSSQNSYVEALCPSVMILWDVAFGKLMGIDEVTRWGLIRWD